MDEQDLVDVEVTHEEPDDFFDAIAAADVADAADISDASETVDADASEVADAGATDFPAHRRTVIANRLLAGQPDTELRSLSTVDEGQVKLLEHQVDAAHRALFEMDGKALLADEVGLGKTIEVGMILREMHYRETDGSVLILTPAQLAKQWQGELATKFGLEFVCNYDEDFEGFDAHDCIITSIDTAKSDRHRDTVLARDWDVLVMDEAHYVKNEATDRYALVQNLTYDYAFFLTATPIQNELTDLYNVVSLLRPGLFGSRDTFHRYFLNSNQETLVNRNELQRRLREVMIRNRRAETDIDFTDRVIDTRTFEPSDAERDLYDAVTEYVRGAYSRDSGQKLVLMLLQKEVVSSPAALARTVRRKLGEPNERDERDRRGEQKGLRELGELPHREQLEAILDAADAIETATKEQRLFDIVEEAREHVEGGRAIVFTQFRATQERILRTLDGAGYTTHAFHGGHSSDEKEAIVERFREEGGVLVSTDAMNEGRNLQFCNIMVNYDLPWNPMTVEQRIGRIHRIGQKRDVYVFNMALRGTIEEYVLERLYQKIDLFTKTVGELSTVLTRLETSGASFEDEIFDRLVDAGSDAELENDFDAMAVDLENGTDLSRKVERFNSGVFEGFDLGASDD